jgi:excisionase family DNA binding protein
MSANQQSHPAARRPNPSPDDLLTAEEVAALLRVTTGWVYAETRNHRIPHLRLGRYVRYRRAALDAWMNEVEHVPRTLQATRRAS